ncbi:hypothetical protein LZD49_33800 [Dyadobacter sp. CY261]|nr:hypothetical protein [Dyadobacter sp. CY261]MCF0075501.1 hypothetical protein [Dyadobacter sp. CY261]
MEVSELKRMKDLEEENRRLKKRTPPRGRSVTDYVDDRAAGRTECIHRTI